MDPQIPAQAKNVKSALLLIEGFLIILLVIFSGFLAYQNQKLTRLIRGQSQATPSPSPEGSATPTPSPVPTEAN